MKPVSKWTIAEVEEQFNLNFCKTINRLSQWTDDPPAISSAEEKLRKELRDKLTDHVWDWNDGELKGKFIFSLLMAVNFDNEHYQSFIEREIAVEMENDRIAGTVDFLVATGRRYPKHPYFFIHEYKKEYESSVDPFGQLLVAMIAAQKINNDGKPVYGCYVMGRLWFFVILDGQDYAVSLAYDATKDEINEIFILLKKVKGIIEELIDLPPK
jgi:hypothetical protein